MSATTSATPNVEDDEMAPLVSSLLVVFLVLVLLLMAVLVAIAVYLIFVRGTYNDGYATIRLLRTDKKSSVHGNYKLCKQKDKSDHHWLRTTSSTRLVLNYIDELAENKSRIDEDWKLLESNGDSASSTMVTSQAAWSIISIVAIINIKIFYYQFDGDHHRPKYLVASDPQLGHTDELWELVTKDHIGIIVTLSDAYSDSCKTYWPRKGTKKYGKLLVRLVSEHKHDSSFVIRSFVIQDGQFSLTVTQYHLLKWPHLVKPSSIKSLLEFRRKVNQSLSIPILIHCSNGISRTGTYCLIDIVLNRICKGVREFDVSATLEHLRDQKQGMVPTKELYELAIAAIVEGTQDMFSEM